MSNTNSVINIAIDGPAGSGKSTLAKRLAKEQGYIYVDTGAMYRAMALYLIRQEIDPGDAEKIERACQDVDITIDYVNNEQVVLLNGENVNGLIRTEEVSKMASVSSANGRVREKLVALQKELAKKRSVVMDGRDIGTVVLPNAQVKIYMDASPRVRAKRRYDELSARGEACDLETIEQEIIERDHRDMTRENSPLKQAEDAVYLNTSELSVEEVLVRMKEIINDRLGNGPDTTYGEKL
ncbi:MAG: (d)CMP kinase [Lachnospiraceae bacterium]|nr:(d)CMP kinase [Lachnospiraceae bacterium]